MTSTPTSPRSTPRRVLILGAQGRFGRAATQAFVDAGWQVLAQVRRAPAQPWPTAPDGRAVVQTVIEPLTSVPALAAACGGPVDVLVWAVNPPYTAWDQTLLPLAELGMDLAERLGARFVLPGNVYNHGPRPAAQLLESTPVPGPAEPNTPKGRLRIELEQRLQARAPRLRSLVLRAGDFFGSGRGNWFDEALVKNLPAGRLVYPGPDDREHAWAYLPDLTRALVTLCERLEDQPDALPSPAAVVHGPSFNLTGRALLDALEAAARRTGLAPATPGRPMRRSRLPWTLMRLAGLFVPMLRALAEMRYLWWQPHALHSAHLGRLLPDWQPTPLADALDASLRELFPAQTRAAGTAAPAKVGTTATAATPTGLPRAQPSAH